MSSKSRGKVGRHFGIAVGPAHSSRRADGRKWPLCAPISIFSLRRRPPRRCDSSSRHATPLLATLQLAGSTRLSFSYIACASQIDGEKRSDFNIGASGNFYRKSRDGRSLTLSSRPPPFLSTLSLQPFRSLTTRPKFRDPPFFLFSSQQLSNKYEH